MDKRISMLINKYNIKGYYAEECNASYIQNLLNKIDKYRSNKLKKVELVSLLGTIEFTISEIIGYYNLNNNHIKAKRWKNADIIAKIEYYLTKYFDFEAMVEVVTIEKIKEVITNHDKTKFIHFTTSNFSNIGKFGYFVKLGRDGIFIEYNGNKTFCNYCNIYGYEYIGNELVIYTLKYF